jgi:hypothetical protein
MSGNAEEPAANATNKKAGRMLDWGHILTRNPSRPPLKLPGLKDKPEPGTLTLRGTRGAGRG